MSKKVPISTAIFCTLFPSITKAEAQVSKQNQPNILVFIADDAGMDFGCYGNPNIKTPNIDRLAENGVRFDKAFVASPQSSPSRTSMMTGMFAHSIGTEDLHSSIDADTKMMPHYFRQAGYFTGSMLKAHWGEYGNKQFNRIISGGYKGGGGLTEETYNNYERFIKDAGPMPFFLWVGFIDPHRPYFRVECPQVNSPTNISVPPYLVNDTDTKRDLADYYDEISRMDENIGKMLEILESSGKLDNTVIVFLSDNGMPFPRCKGTLYDSGIQTPLIFSWKEYIPSGTVHSNGLISLVDLAPTLLEFAGIEIKNKVYGESFYDILFDSSRRGRDYIFAERNWHDTDEYIRCVRTEKYKLIYNAYYEIPHGTPIDLSTSPSWYSLKKQQRKGLLNKEQNQIFISPRPMVEIYDLENDPHELNNIADIQFYYNEGLKLAKLLIDWQKETEDHNWWRRRRPDQSDRITGFPMFSIRQDFWQN